MSTQYLTVIKTWCLELVEVVVVVTIIYFLFSRSEAQDVRSRHRKFSSSANHDHLKRQYASCSEAEEVVDRMNHDHLKRQYASCSEAEEVVDRMRRQGADPDGTLRCYYNPHYGKWFVGNSRY
jgi:hypothetical protein